MKAEKTEQSAAVEETAKQEMQETTNLPGNIREIIWRSGDAPKIFQKEPKAITVVGALSSIMRYIAHRKPDVNKAHAELDRQAMFCMLFTNGNDQMADIIKGQIEINPDLKRFHINSNKQFSRTDMKSFLRQNRFFFPNKDKHAELVLAIGNFDAKAIIDVKQSENNRGNKIDNFSKTVDSNIPLDCVISVPIFVGEKPVKVALEIAYDITEEGPVFWFESADVDEIMRNAIETQFDALRDELDEANILNFEV